jgi:hypothetical protein
MKHTESENLSEANSLLLSMLSTMCNKPKRKKLDQLYIDTLIQVLKLLPVSNEFELRKYY